MENSLKIKNFHIKRIHTGKHVLYLQSLKGYFKAKEILIAANTAYYTYTPNSQKPHTYLLKGLGNIFTETEILEDLKALKINEVQFTKGVMIHDKKINGEQYIAPNLHNSSIPR